MISLCITTYNRTTLLYESFRQVLNDDRISEIIIVDDNSDEQTKTHLVSFMTEMKDTKVRIFFNETNLGCYHNKKKAVELASNEWVILFDSDNIISTKYIDALFSIPDIDSAKLLIHPVFARPHFNFLAYEGKIITKNNVHQFASESTFTTALNAMNYFVNRSEYLRVWEQRSEPWTADSLLQNYNWINAGNAIYFCPGLEYEHRVHDGSHYKEHHRKTGNLYNELVQKLKNMR